MDAKFDCAMGRRQDHLDSEDGDDDSDARSVRGIVCHSVVAAGIVACSAMLSHALSLGPAVGALLAVAIVVRFYAAEIPRDRPAAPLCENPYRTHPKPTSPGQSATDTEKEKETKAKTGDLCDDHARWTAYRAGISDAYGGQAEFDTLCDTAITPHSFASDEWLRVGRYDSDDGTLLRGQLASIGDKCVLHGYGMRTTPDGTVHEGKWYLGQPDGMGRRTMPDGRIIEGHWAWDVPDDICTTAHM